MAVQPVELAKRYLHGNAAIREALGLCANAPLEIASLAQGEHNANFVVRCPSNELQFALRINFESQLGLEDQIGYEAHALQALEPSGRTARLLFVDGSKERIDHGVLAMELLQGRHLDFHRPGDVEEAARILADIHSVRPGSSCKLLHPDDPLQAQLETCKRFFARWCASPFANSLVASYVEGFIDQVELALQGGASEADACHIQNTEAVPSHFLMTESGPGRMVDWEKPIIGEVAQDVAYFLSPTTTIWDTDYLFDPPARTRFLHEYWSAVDGRFAKGRFEERYPAFVMSNALLGITWSCNAVVDYHDPSKPLKNKKTEDLLDIYLSEAFLKRVQHDCFERQGQ